MQNNREESISLLNFWTNITGTIRNWKNNLVRENQIRTIILLIVLWSSLRATWFSILQKNVILRMRVLWSSAKIKKILKTSPNLSLEWCSKAKPASPPASTFSKTSYLHICRPSRKRKMIKKSAWLMLRVSGLEGIVLRSDNMILWR